MILSPEERVSSLRLGAAMAFAAHGVKPSDLQKMAAGGVNGPAILSPLNMAKAIVTVAAITGVPLGIAAHVVGQHLKASRGNEREIEAQTSYYRNASQQLGSGLQAAV